MANQRMVKTSLWSTSRKFSSCDPIEKLLFLYLITNERVELCGAYEVFIEEIGLRTGLDYRETLPELLRRLENKGLAIYRDGWVVIPGYEGHQNTANSKVRAGIESSKAMLPPHIRSLLEGTPMSHDETSMSEDETSMSPADLDSDSDSDIDSDGDSDSDRAPAGGARLPEPGDTVLRVYREELNARLPTTSWPDTHGQYGALRELSRMTRETQPQTPIETPEDYALLIVRAFERRKSIGKTDYWRTASYEPKTVLRRFGELTQDLAELHGADRLLAEGEAALERLQGAS